MNKPNQDYDDVIIPEKKSPERYTQRTYILFKILLAIGIIFIFISAVLMLNSSEENEYNILSQTFLSLSIILFAFSAILYFFKRQFDKLADIADEIENSVYEEDEECNIEKL